MIISSAAYDAELVLEHHGVKGMRWGVRRNPTTGVRPAAASLNSSKFGRAAKANVDRHNQRVSNRALNKASRAKDRKTFDKTIDKARARTEGTTRAAKLGLTDGGSKSHLEFKAAKAQYKIDKQKMGSREARKILNKASEKRMNDIATSQMAKSGKETTLVVLGAVGLVGLHVLASANQ